MVFFLKILWFNENSKLLKDLSWKIIFSFITLFQFGACDQ